ncbi:MULTISPECIES: hypothetical protein [unclassified Methylophaga]|jgi:hypothetical protein|uniref:hypothetical protein n=1 Tax=unclassified Methylophaga TaxID=2629249 RepID=UPI000C42617D|nr:MULTISPECIES: hypothetical protein [unclassified Methylophaga]MAL51013.1 hypothetical protein [Methylophaga sp.]MBP23903.1 hypothetical protein [Methylophaga sp.]HCC82270.1 hypothetical protein [Methylophaga sp.]|tara:strand:- start:14491 stop:14742 length:252 start_codon:yes stop_codon:yes gene_type:complete
MYLVNDLENMIFDSEDDRCKLIKAMGPDGKIHAFIQCLDIGNIYNRLKKPHEKQYWGFFSPDEPEESIKEIMRHGVKWPAIPS